MENYDVIVLVLGALGSAAVYQLAKSGAKVLGIDQFAPPHTQGSIVKSVAVIGLGRIEKL